MNLVDVATIVLGVCLIAAAALLANISVGSRWKRFCKAALLSVVAFMGMLLFTAKLAHPADSVPPVLMVANPPNGALVELHNVSGPCVAPAKLATWVAPDRKSSVPGCFKVNEDGTLVGISWLDGDTSTIPTRVFHPPEGV